MDLTVMDSQLTSRDGTEWIGYVRFTFADHRKPYEITLQSEDGSNWNYTLHFASEPGSEEQIQALDEQLEEDDDLFERLVNALLASQARDV